MVDDEQEKIQAIDEYRTERQIEIDNAPTWLKAKEQRLLISTTPNLAPTNRMFLPNGQIYETKFFPPDRVRANGEERLVRYDIEYVLDFYQQRIVRQLSLENQLTLLKAINALYTADTFDLVNRLPDTEKLQLCKDLAKTLGKRVINK